MRFWYRYIPTKHNIKLVRSGVCGTREDLPETTGTSTSPVCCEERSRHSLTGHSFSGAPWRVWAHADTFCLTALCISLRRPSLRTSPRAAEDPYHRTLNTAERTSQPSFSSNTSVQQNMCLRSWAQFSGYAWTKTFIMNAVSVALDKNICQITFILMHSADAFIQT